MKKILSLTLALLMILACTPIVMAESEFEYVDYEGGIAITGYNGKGGVVTIPAEIDGKKVVAIDKIEDRNDITKLILPEGLTELCRAALVNMSNLKEIVLPKTLKKIGFEALAFTGITSITIPESVTEIGNGAFNGSQLKSLHIPKNAKLSGSIIAYSTTIKKITVDSAHPTYAADGKYLYSKTGVAVDYAGGLTDKRIVIPNYIKNIMHYCFINNQYIETVITHKTLEKIYYWTFNGCPNLKEVYVTGKNTLVSNYITDNPNLIVYTNGKICDYAEGEKDTSDEYIVKPYIEGMENPNTPTTTEKAKETTTKPITTTKPSVSKTEKETVADGTTESTTETTLTTDVSESTTLKETEANTVVNSGNVETTGSDKNKATPIIIGVVVVAVAGAVATGVAVTMKKKKK